MKQGQTVVFVCEHGSAKSVVAAANFNRLAGERGLGLRAVSRGTDPDAEIAPNAEAGLRAVPLRKSGRDNKPIEVAPYYTARPNNLLINRD